MEDQYEEIYKHLFPGSEVINMSIEEDDSIDITYKDKVGEYYLKMDQYKPGFYSITITVEWNGGSGCDFYDFKISVYKPAYEIASVLNSALNEIKVKYGKYECKDK